MTADDTTARKCLALLLLAVVWLGATVNRASASSLTFLDSPAAISPAFTTVWGAPGPDGTFKSSPLTQGQVTVTGAAGFTIFRGDTYNADFLPTEWVLALFDPGFNPLPGVFSLNFAVPTNAAGARVQALSFGAFSGTISAFDASNALLGGFTVSGFNNGNGDGTAVFAGIRSDSANIRRLEFAGFGDGAAIGQLTTSVPEPSTFAMLIGGGAVLSAHRRRRSRR